jgi:hypothetical protein
MDFARLRLAARFACGSWTSLACGSLRAALAAHVASARSIDTGIALMRGMPVIGS